MQSPVATQRIYLFILFVTNNYEENEKFNSQDIYFIATRELSLITMQASRCDRERSPRPSPCPLAPRWQNDRDRKYRVGCSGGRGTITQLHVHPTQIDLDEGEKLGNKAELFCLITMLARRVPLLKLPYIVNGQIHVSN